MQNGQLCREQSSFAHARPPLCPRRRQTATATRPAPAVRRMRSAASVPQPVPRATGAITRVTGGVAELVFDTQADRSWRQLFAGRVLTVVVSDGVALRNDFRNIGE